MPFPTEIRIGTRRFPIVQKPLEGRLGYFNRATGEIAVKIDEPEAGKYLILLHELLHFSAELLIQNKVIKKQPPESFITNAAPTLLTLLVNAGLWNGLTEDELNDFYESHIKEGE